jgi:hypothetical protein
MRRPLVILVAATAMLGAACSSDSPSPATTTSTAAAESTTSTSAPTTTVEETTTSTPEPVGSESALRGDGLGVVEFGAAPDEAVAAMTAVLGEPTADTGWEPSFSTYGTCPGAQIRGVEWGGLVLLFTDGDTTYGSGEHLFSWRVTGAPPALSTVGGLGFGATAADAEELYPGQIEAVPPEDPFPGFLRIAAEGGPITAFLDAGDSITNLEAGVSCGE